MVKQNLGSWFLDTSPISPHVAGLLNKAIFPFQSTLASRVLAFEWQTAKSELGNICFSSFLSSLLILCFFFVCFWIAYG